MNRQPYIFTKNSIKVKYHFKILYSIKMRNIKCAFHPHQTIVNFCKNEQCLLPMCPTCIKLHTKEHMKENTHGNYESIVEVYGEVERNLIEIQNAFENCREEVKEARRQKQDASNGTRKKMRQMRSKIMEIVEKYLETVEKEIYDSLRNIEAGVQEHLKSIEDSIEEKEKELQRELKLLRGQKTLKIIINHLAEQKAAYYENVITDASFKVRETNLTGILISKEFKLHHLSDILKTIKCCYESIFTDTLHHKPPKTLDFKNLSFSTLSKASD